MFQSEIFRSAFAAVSDAHIELYSTDGSEGAARGAGIGVGMFQPDDAFAGLERERAFSADDLPADDRAGHRNAFEHWRTVLAAQTGVS
jgi:xylulokinase